MPNDISLTIGFEADANDLETVLSQQAEGIGSTFKSMTEAVQQTSDILRDMVQPMRELKDLANDISRSFGTIKDSAQSMREAVASTRLQTGLGTGGAGAGGGAGGLDIGGLLFRSLRTAGTFGAAGAAGAAGVAGATAMFGTNILGPLLAPFVRGAGFVTGTDVERMASRMEEAPYSTAEMYRAARTKEDELRRRSSAFFPIQRIMSGESFTDVLQTTDPRQMAGAYGMLRGFAGGIGRGPTGLISQVVGGAYGAMGGVRVGGELAQTLGLPRELGGIVGAEIGRTTISGMLERYIQEGMQRYPGYLGTAASMAAPAQYGANVGMLRGLRPARFGISPEQFGPEFSSLYQGFGGGELSRDLVETSMAYMRTYGVGMGQIGQAAGGIINIGGGGQFASAEQREQMTLRIMTDAVAAGFGRRLPEFAQSISSSIGIALAGPGLIGQDELMELAETVSRLTGRISRARGIGLQQAGRVIAPVVQAPGALLQQMLSGGGDPLTMGLMYGTSRERFGGDIFEMMFSETAQGGPAGLLEATRDPFGAGMQFLAPMISTLLGTSDTRATAAFSLQDMFQGMGIEAPPEVIRDLVTQGMPLARQARREGRELGSDEILSILTGLEDTQADEGDELRRTMRSIQASGEEIMDKQLGAMVRAADFSEKQFAVSQAMAADARLFHDVMLAETLASAQAIGAGPISQALQNINRVRREGARQFLTRDEPDVSGYIEYITSGMLREFGEIGAVSEAPVVRSRAVRDLKESIGDAMRGGKSREVSNEERLWGLFRAQEAAARARGRGQLPGQDLPSKRAETDFNGNTRHIGGR